MKPELLHILQHSLGCDKYGQSKHRGRDEGDGCFGYYRNRYVCDPCDDIKDLVVMGLMSDHGPHSMTGGMHFYSVTQKGLDVMLSISPKPPKIYRSAARYQEYLSVADCFDNFRHFLKYHKASQ